MPVLQSHSFSAVLHHPARGWLRISSRRREAGERDLQGLRQSLVCSVWLPWGKNLNLGLRFRYASSCSVAINKREIGIFTLFATFFPDNAQNVFNSSPKNNSPHLLFNYLAGNKCLFSTIIGSLMVINIV